MPKASVLDELVTTPKETTHKRGTILITPEKEPAGIFYLHEGLVRQFTLSQTGTELTAHFYVPKTFFPLSLAVNKIPNRYFFEAVSDVKISIIPKEKIVKMLQNNNEFSFETLKRFIFAVDGLTRRLETNSFGNACKRVASILIYLSSHFADIKNNRAVFKYKFTHANIASMVGITRESTSLELKRMEKLGLISYQDHFIVLEDLERLQQEMQNN